MDDAPALSLTDPEVQKCFFQAYDMLRTQAPVYVDPVTGFYVLTRYEDVRKALLDTKNLSNSTGLIQNRKNAITDRIHQLYAEQGWLPIDTLVTNDPPSHKTYRSLVDRAFTTQRVLQLEPYIQGIADELIDGFIDAGEVEFVSKFALHLPMRVIADQLGVPRADIDKFKRWTDVSIAVNSPVIDAETEMKYHHILIEFQQYFAAKAEQFRQTPADNLFSDLVHAEIDGRRLDTRELLSILQQLLVAGNETTTNALAAGVKLMVENPDQVQAMRNAPETLVTFVEETLRLSAPAQNLFRRAKQDMEIGGTRIPEGAIVVVSYGGANRDPAKFGCPAALDVERKNAGAHLAFGTGVHICIGNQLARAEMRVGFSRILARLGNIRFARGADSYTVLPDFVHPNLAYLHLAFDKI